MRIFVICIMMLPLVSGCARVELASHIGKKIAGTTANAKSKGYYKVGSPYKIRGKKYYPRVDYDYNKTGMASWYGPNFHGKQTANGEVFNQNDLTAAHKTLPLPSIVRVTNLSNGKSLIVRVNDRGPYAHKRIIDLSKRSAELLGFKNKGIAKVRVQVLEAESRMVTNAAQNKRDTRGMEISMNKSSYKSPQIAKATLQANPVPPVISEYNIGAPRVFVQTGSFTSRNNAMKLASSFDDIGRAQVHTVTVDDVKYYRVRLPSPNISKAKDVLAKVLAGGHKNARIVVD